MQKMLTLISLIPLRTYTFLQVRPPVLKAENLRVFFFLEENSCLVRTLKALRHRVCYFMACYIIEEAVNVTEED